MDWRKQTLEYYKTNTDSFVKGTLAADMSQTQNRFLDKLPEHAYILDFGCGSGRDTKVFLDNGYQVDAVDGSEEVCREASRITGIPVKQMFFSDLDAEAVYDGIWACASILHLPRTELTDVLNRISKALKNQGVLYTSFKYGSYEGFRGSRWFTDFTEESLNTFWKEVQSLEIFEIWITHDVRPGREEERWINLLARRN
jgi:SAM-dependent methyltransferase